MGVGGCVPCFYDDTIFQFHLSENNICLLIRLSAGSQCKAHINIEGSKTTVCQLWHYLWSEAHSFKVTNIDINI